MRRARMCAGWTGVTNHTIDQSIQVEKGYRRRTLERLGT